MKRSFALYIYIYNMIISEQHEHHASGEERGTIEREEHEVGALTSGTILSRIKSRMTG